MIELHLFEKVLQINTSGLPSWDVIDCIQHQPLSDTDSRDLRKISSLPMLRASFDHHVGQFLEEAEAQREELLDVPADTQLQVTSPGVRHCQMHFPL